jgi:8-oxo-dGTP pyrophosphatase MutT (NUDIX family)
MSFSPFFWSLLTAFSVRWTKAHYIFLPMLALKGPTLTPFSMRDKQIAARYSVFGVERHELVQEGKRIRDVFTFEMRDWCNVVAVTDTGELVLVWQWRFGTKAFSLETPGGVIDEGESPEAAARRELLEETGYEAASIEHLITNEPNPALQGNRCFSFLALGAKRVRMPGGGDFDEQCEVELVKKEHAMDLILENHVRHALCQVALMAYAMPR